MSGKAFGAAESSTFCDARSTEAFLVILCEGMPAAKAERFRELMVELGARPEYVAAIDPATAFQRMTRERNAAIVAALEFYPGSASGSARELARSWTRYLAAAWKRGRGPEGGARLAALHELCRITDGAEPLSPGQIAQQGDSRFGYPVQNLGRAEQKG